MVILIKSRRVNISNSIIALFLVTMCFLTQIGFSQPDRTPIIITGHTLDKDSGLPLPYVNIGFANTTIGTISDNDGSYYLETSDTMLGKDLIFSFLGYQDGMIKLSGISDTVKTVIFLEKKTFTLHEVVVKAPLKEDLRWLGNRVRSVQKQGQMYADGHSAGGAIALMITKKDFDDLIYVKKVSFYIAQNTFPEFKARLRFLSVSPQKDHLPDKDLVEENIICQSTIKRGWLDFNIADRNLKIESDSFYIVYEWILNTSDRNAYQESIDAYIGEYPNRIKIDTLGTNANDPVRIELEYNLSILSTIVGDTRSRKALKKHRCYFRTNSFAKWEKAPGIVSARIQIGNYIATQAANSNEEITDTKASSFPPPNDDQFINDTARIPWQERLLAPLDYSYNKLPAESIYIQTSKDIFETQEDLWFKAYVLNAQTLAPSILSRTLYVELIRVETDSVVWKEKYEIQEGIADGHIFLADSLTRGTYWIAAFTAHSFTQNSPEIHAIRKIEVIDFIRNYSKDFPLIDRDSIRLSLLPEGGNLIVGLRNKVAFKATEKQGRPIDVSGILLENGQEILKFKSVHAGMGSFSFIPKKGSEYLVKLDDQEATGYPLPEIQKGGMVMHLQERDAQALVFQIDQSRGLEPTTIYLRTQMRGEAQSIATGVIDSTLKFKVPLDKMPQGIAEVTLFDEHFNPVAERLVYVHQEKKLTIKTNLPTEGHLKRGKTTFKIKVSDENGAPVSTTLGLSICESIFKDTENPNNILSYYYLSSQIRGKIYDPAYYFDGKNEDRSEALDLLLLTQGWRRYIWNHKRLQEIPIIEETPIIDGIRGTIQPRRKRRWEKGTYPTLVAYVPEQSEGTNFINVASNGKFMVEPDHLKIGEGGYTYIKYFPTDDAKFDIELDDYAFSIIDGFWESSSILLPLTQRRRQIFDNEKIALRSGSDIIQLDEIVVKAKKRRQGQRDKYLGKLDSIAKLELTNDYVCKHNNLNCPGCLGDTTNYKPREGEIYWLVQVWENNRFVDATQPPEPGQRFTKKRLPPYQYPKLTDAYLLENFNLIRTKGYYGHKEFYQPDHEELYDPAPDYRNTLLWAPQIKTDEHGEATITFFCSDLPGLFIGEIEGVSRDGRLGHYTFEFVVEN